MKKATIREAQIRMLDILKEIDRICRKNEIEYWLESGTLLGAVRHGGFIPWDDDLDIGMMRSDYIKFINIVNNEILDQYICQTPKTDKLTESAFIKIRDLNSDIRHINNYGEYTGLFVDIFPYDNVTISNAINKKICNTIVLAKWFGDLKVKKPYIRNLHKNLIIYICKLLKIFLRYLPYSEIMNILYKKGFKADIKDSAYIDYGVEVPFKIKLKREEIFPLKTLKFEGIDFPVPNEYICILEKLYGHWKELPNEENRIPSHSENIYIN